VCGHGVRIESERCLGALAEADDAKLGGVLANPLHVDGVSLAYFAGREHAVGCGSSLHL